jgi:hypothetical protein
MPKRIINPEINNGQESKANEVQCMLISIPTMNKIKVTLSGRYTAIQSNT